MASSEVKEALRSSAAKVADYVRDAATLTVTTHTQDVGAANATPVLAAKTIISLDGDNDSVLPTQRDEDDRVSVDSAIYELHMENVAAAIEYRARMLDAMLGLLRSTRG